MLPCFYTTWLCTCSFVLLLSTDPFIKELFAEFGAVFIDPMLQSDALISVEYGC